jgi:deoxyribonuclease IV
MIGSNVSTAGGIANAFIWAEKWGAECVQLYTTPSRRWHVPARADDEVKLFRQRRQASGDIPVVAHVPYLVNLASPDSETRYRSIERLILEVESAETLGIDWIILHPGSSVGDDISTGIDRTVAGLNEVLTHRPNSDVKVLLETMAGRGSEIGGRLEDLAAIIMRVDLNHRMGICFDTCHVYSAGYDIRGSQGFQSVMDDLDKVIGIGRLGAFHMNDSRHPLGSRVDRHCAIGVGLLGLEVFQSIVTDRRFANLPAISESPEEGGGCLHDIQVLKQLRAMPERVADPPLSTSAATGLQR